MSTILITGMAGFIGSWTAEALLQRGDTVVGIDNFSPYYDPSLKRDRLKKIPGSAKFYEVDLAQHESLDPVFRENKIDQVCHLAAQPGVRYSFQNPLAYENANNRGTLNLLELCRHHGVKSLVLASSSSVYGGNTKLPFSVSDHVDHPISLYAATKRYNELLGYTYHHLFGIHCTALRFFTVYGPWGRPDMAPMKFTKAILEGRPIEVYNQGKMKRDFTYITDIVDGILAALDKNYPYEIFNLGHSESVGLTTFIECLEKELGKKATVVMLPLQPGDVPETYADIESSKQKLGFKPKVKIEQGLKQFATWYKDYFGIKNSV